MFGIGLPEMILILALALIVVGPDKLPELARSVAKGVMELKKTAEGLKQSLTEDGNPLDEIRPELEDTAKSLKDNLLDSATYSWKDGVPPDNVQPPTFSVPEESDTTEAVPLAPTEDPPADKEDNPPASKSPKVNNSVRDDLAAGPKS